MVDERHSRVVLSRIPDYLFQELIGEMISAGMKFGDQLDLPSGTEKRLKFSADRARALCKSKAESGDVTWRDILTEEFQEAICEEDPERLRAELYQVAAVALRWIIAVDSGKQRDE